MKTMYTKTELTRIQKQFYHPHAERIYNLLKQAEDPDATPETLKELESITSTCEICQRLSMGPGRFRVSLPPGIIVFNKLCLHGPHVPIRKIRLTYRRQRHSIQCCYNHGTE